LSDFQSSGDQFRSSGHVLIDIIADYLDECSQSTLPVTIPLDPDLSYNIWKDELAKPGLNTVQLFARIIRDSNHLHHPGYIGHQVAVSHPLSLLADLIAGLLNNGGAVYEMGQVSVTMERAVCRTLTDLIGWDDQSTGIFTSGGTLANLTALLTARQVHSKGMYWDEGHGQTDYAVMVSAEAHYCIARSVKIMGLGSDSVITLPVNEKFQLDISAMQETYDQARAKGKTIFAFVGNAGSTGTGSYDDLEAIGRFCKQHNIWFHVDGAHGGAVLLSKRYKSLIKGLELADSMTLDFHKLLQTSILCTTLLYKSYTNSHQTFSQGASYLYENHQPEWYQLGKRTFECTKTMMVLKAYTLLHQLGMERLAKDVDYRYDLAKQFADILLANKNFELATYPQSNIVCFRFVSADQSLEHINLLNQKIRLHLNASGKYYLVQTTIQDKIYLRTSLMNPYTRLEILLQLISDIQSFAS
jgi:L-2,4-diaminobutyrate decarboxylase